VELAALRRSSMNNPRNGKGIIGASGERIERKGKKARSVKWSRRKKVFVRAVEIEIA
jgi:hypothetical protein